MAKEKKSEGGIWETIKTIVFALLLAGIFRTVFYQPFWIPSGSMKDTLLIGDYIFVNKMAYGYSYASCPSIRIASIGINLDAQKLCSVIDGDNTRILGRKPKLGDVVVFRHPKTGVDYIKRLVGLPGDKVQLREGVLYINGEEAKQREVEPFIEVMEPQGPMRLTPRCANGTVGFGGQCSKERFVETFPNGIEHSILNIAHGQGSDDTAVYTVPEDHYFFVGDNRDNSLDSRFLSGNGVGFVPYENIIGRADRILLSSAGKSMFAFWTWRSDRFLKGIE